ncbi:S-layer homology domain-containing protein [Ammoniphilus sp. 3BR4]|uniref:S-layer homology domain-containing protein n=1 Tax=Ammoniphilus sp. 3BR4 TaxID=3158265 RepID=UPI0034660306
MKKIMGAALSLMLIVSPLSAFASITDEVDRIKATYPQEWSQLTQLGVSDQEVATYLDEVVSKLKEENITEANLSERAKIVGLQVLLNEKHSNLLNAYNSDAFNEEELKKNASFVKNIVKEYVVDQPSTGGGGGGGGSISVTPVPVQAVDAPLLTVDMLKKQEGIGLVELEQASFAFKLDQAFIDLILQDSSIKQLVVKTGNLSLLIPTDSLKGKTAVSLSLKEMDIQGSKTLTAGYQVVMEGDILADLALEMTYAAQSLSLNRMVSVEVNSATQLTRVPALFSQQDQTVTVKIENVQNGKTYAILSNEVDFSDIQQHWAKENIRTMAAKMVVKGMPNGEFAPNKVITRAEFTTLLVKALNLQSSGNASLPFKDVKSNDWFAHDLAIAYQAGVIQGLSANTFAPSKALSRQEMAVILAKALELQAGSSELGFDDKNRIASWAQDAVSSVVQKGYMKGLSDKEFAPLKQATRAEATTILYQVLKEKGYIN